MTKGGTFVTSMGLLVTIAWMFIWPIGDYTRYWQYGEALGLLVLSIGLSGLFMGPILGMASTTPEWKDSRIIESVRAWKRVPSEPLPPIQAGDASIVVDTSTGETHWTDVPQYLRFAVQALAGCTMLILGMMISSVVSRLSDTQYESTINTKGALLWSGLLTIGPVMLIVLTWLALYLTRHSIEIHTNGITVHGILRRYTFSNSSNTAMVIPGMPKNHRTTYFIDRTTGRGMSTWMISDELMSQLGQGRTYMDQVILVEEPRKDLARYIPFFAKQTVLIVSLISWYIGAVVFYVMLTLNPDLF